MNGSGRQFLFSPVIHDRVLCDNLRINAPHTPGASTHMSERYEDSQLYRIRHSAAHIMAEAVLEIFPDGHIAIGPPIEDGFYYDFELPRPLTEDDLADIETRMKRIIKGNFPFIRREVSAAEAKKLFA